MAVIPLFADRQRMQDAIDGEVSVDWTEAKRKLPAAPLFLVTSAMPSSFPSSRAAWARRWWAASRRGTDGGGDFVQAH
jgi:hypothetical protein